MMAESGFIYLFAFEGIITGFMKRKGEMKWGSVTILEHIHVWERKVSKSRRAEKGPYNLRWKLNVSADDQVFYSQHLIL